MIDVVKLIRRAQRNDAAAAEQLVVRFGDMAVGYAYSVLGDFHLAEDAAQEAFIEALTTIQSLREPHAFTAWLKRIVFKHCDRQTRRKRVYTVNDPAAADQVASRTGIDLQAQRAEETDTVMHALNELTDKQRHATVLYYINGYSHAEIASFLEVTPAVVKSRLHRARQQLKERLFDMVADTLKQNAPDESFAHRVAEAVAVYTAKGPSTNSIPSEWHDAIGGKTLEIIQAGEEGYQIDLALAESPKANARKEAAIHFGIRRDLRALPHVQRLLHDESTKVRSAAVLAFAGLIHPNRPGFGLFHGPADSVPDEIDSLIDLLSDPNDKIRMRVLTALRPYAHLDDERITVALNRALQDPKHRVAHLAACHLRITCPSCGKPARPLGQFVGWVKRRRSGPTRPAGCHTASIRGAVGTCRESRSPAQRKSLWSGCHKPGCHGQRRSAAVVRVG